MKRNIFVAFVMFLIMPFAFMLAACSDGDELPSNAIKITNTTELIAAINNQEENQYWILSAGTYDIDRFATNVEYENQTGWYLPIIKNGITIHGNGNVVLTSSVTSVNGAWSSQNFITIFADNVTIRDVKIICKKEVNKSIEILGKNTTLKNVTFDTPEDYEFAGSIYLHPTAIAENTEGDVGTLTLDNVKLNKGRITATGANKGKIVFKNVKIDWTNVEEDVLDIYPMYQFNVEGKEFEFEGAKTVEVKLSASELGEKYEEATSNLVANVKVVNIDA